MQQALFSPIIMSNWASFQRICFFVKHSINVQLTYMNAYLTCLLNLVLVDPFICELIKLPSSRDGVASSLFVQVVWCQEVDIVEFPLLFHFATPIALSIDFVKILGWSLHSLGHIALLCRSGRYVSLPRDALFMLLITFFVFVNLLMIFKF